jgi:ubiquinone/menaquinone biosynthesis C-methylase UbiE
VHESPFGAIPATADAAKGFFSPKGFQVLSSGFSRAGPAMHHSFYTFQTKVLNHFSLIKWLRSYIMYPTLTELIKNQKISFLNYGYATLDPTSPPIALDAADEPNRFCIQLYHHVASAVDLQNAHVIEASCGHGGGADYVMRYLRPAMFVGVDLNPRAIEFCRQHHVHHGLSFVHGSAEALDFENESFDVVINLEASHCYGSMERFLREVARVLRPGGHFLFADIRRQDAINILNTQLAQSGLEMLSVEDITDNVLRAIELDNARKTGWVQMLAPPGLRNFFSGFARLKETPGYISLARREECYLRYVLRKRKL